MNQPVSSIERGGDGANRNGGLGGVMDQFIAVFSAAAVTVMGTALVLSLILPMILGVADFGKKSCKESRIDVSPTSAAIPRSTGGRKPAGRG